MLKRFSNVSTIGWFCILGALAFLTFVVSWLGKAPGTPREPAITYSEKAGFVYAINARLYHYSRNGQKRFLTEGCRPCFVGDTSTVLYQKGTSLWMLDLDKGRPFPIIPSSRAIDQYPVFDERTKKVLFSRAEKGRFSISGNHPGVGYDIWSCDLNGENCRKLTNLRSTENILIHSNRSRSGKVLFSIDQKYYSETGARVNEPAQLFEVDTTTGKLRHLMTRSGHIRSAAEMPGLRTRVAASPSFFTLFELGENSAIKQDKSKMKSVLQILPGPRNSKAFYVLIKDSSATYGVHALYADGTTDFVFSIP